MFDVLYHKLDLASIEDVYQINGGASPNARNFKENSECFEQEKQELQAKCKAEADNNTKLQEPLKGLRNKCLEFGSS